MTVRELLQRSSIDRGETEILLTHVLEVERAWLFAHGDEHLDDAALNAFGKLVEARRSGEPLAYLVGYRDFRTLRLKVSRHVLIPRRETEHLVEWAIERIDAGAQRVLDLGTGSGAVALACKSERPAAELTALDCSVDALECANANAQSLGLQVEWFLSDWFSQLPPAVWDLVVANPPYIAATDAHLQHGDLPAEPESALVGGKTGLESIQHIVEHAPKRLVVGGWLLLEHGFDQADAVAQCLSDRGFENIETRKDWSGHARITGGQWPD